MSDNLFCVEFSREPLGFTVQKLQKDGAAGGAVARGATDSSEPISAGAVPVDEPAPAPTVVVNVTMVEIRKTRRMLVSPTQRPWDWLTANTRAIGRAFKVMPQDGAGIR